MFCFTSGEGTAQNAKAIFHRLMMQGVVNVDYEFGLSSSLGLTQEIRGPIHQVVTQPLGLSQTVDRQHAVPAPSFSSGESLGLSHIVVHAGSFGSGGPQTISAVFNSNTIKGQPLYVVNNTNVDLADNTTNFHVIGLSFEDVSSGSNGKYITEGSISRNNWSSIVGTTLLTPGAVYYLDSTAGMMTSTPTSVEGEHVVAVGRAASNKTLDIEIAEPILL